MNCDRLHILIERAADAPEALPRLRQFVLDLAVRGKLVDQDSNDEPAVELLKQIAAEKARLMQSGLLRKRKPPAPIDSKPFSLPEGWIWTRLREITSDRGQVKPDSEFTYIDVSSIDSITGTIAKTQKLQAANAPSRARKIVRLGDVIYSCVRPYLKNVAIIESEFDPLPIASTAFAILNGHGLVNPHYLWLLLRSSFMTNQVEKYQRGQAYPAINDSDFSLLPTPLPPLAEQHRIVAKVDELMTLCDQLEEARLNREDRRDQLAKASYARLSKPSSSSETFHAHARFAINVLPNMTDSPDQIEQLRQTILELAVRGKLVDQDSNDEPAVELLKQIAAEKARLMQSGLLRKRKPPAPIDSKPFSLPEGWIWTRLREITSDRGQVKPDSEFTYIDVSSIDSITGTIAKTQKLQAANAPSRARKIVRLGDVIYSCVRPYLKNVAIIESEFDPLPIASTAFAILNGHGLVNPHYLWLLLRSSFMTNQVEKYQRGQAYPAINDSDFSLLPTPLPPLAEQHRIVAKVDELLNTIAQLATSSRTTQDKRNRLMESLLDEALEIRKQETV